MNAEFTAVIQQLIIEQGKEVLFSVQKCRALLADYTRGGYKKESRLLLQAIEVGAAKELADAEDLAVCKRKIMRDLRDDFFIAEDAAADVINMLAFVLRGDTAKLAARNPEKPAPQAAIKPAASSLTPRAAPKPAPVKPVLEKDIVRRSLEIWICGRCNTANDFEYDFCKKCGKEFNPPLFNSRKGKEIKIRTALWEMKKK
jgi:ribosomal protein L40E